MLQSGTILGNRYEIIQLVGSGGMADVYKAKCHRLNRMVAIKVLKEEFEKDADFVKRFHVEAQAAAGLLHPNIVNIYDVGEEAGLHYIVMELVEGMTLQSYIHKNGRLTPEETVSISIQIAQGLEAAHSNNTIHRDIKPQNIIVTKDGRVKVTDFGIARASNANTITMATIGSVHYFSPEQARGGYVDARSDIYSLGITMYEMVTGHVPFDGENPVTVALMHLQDEVVLPSQTVPDIPKSLENIILRAVNKKPEFRYPTVTDMIHDLKQVFVQRDGAYVVAGTVPPSMTDSPTIILSGEETDKIKQATDRYKTYVKPQQPVSTEEEKPEETIFQNPDEMNPKLEKLIMVLTILVGIIFAIMFLSFLAKTIGKSSGQQKESVTTTETATTTTASSATTTAAQEELISMPNLVDKTKEEAISILESEGLVAQVQTEISNDVEKDRVIRQSIPYGYDLKRGQTVTIVVSEGKEQITVPDVVNNKESKAKSALTKLGFQVQTKEEFSDTIKEGRVISQSPGKNEKADYGSTISLVISKGKEIKQVPVPALTGKTSKEAQTALKNAGLALGTIKKEYSSSFGEGVVMEQSPASGTTVKEGTSVNIVVSLGEEPKNYRYTGQVTIQNPSGEGEGEQTISLVLVQGQNKKTIYDKKVESSDFPFTVGFDGFQEGAGEIIVYCNGSESDRYHVTLEKVEE